jgi:DNA-binding GntR family transcriptional regulator
MPKTFPRVTADRPEPGQDRLQARLLSYLKRARLPVGSHLTEQEVADALGVSRTPARRMLSALQGLNIVEARPKRGFFLLVPSDGLFEPAIELPVTNDATLFDRIALDRLSGDIPDQFCDDDIVMLYGVSRRMTKRVVADLRAEGVIELLPPDRYRFIPSLLGAEASDASYRFRLTIESAIPLQPGFTIHRTTLQHMREAHERFLTMPADERTNRVAYRIDAEFHEMIAKGSLNPHFLAAITQQNRLRQLMEYRDYNNMQRVETWCREHLTILDALDEGDLERASPLITQHLRNAMAYRPRRDHPS